MSVRVNRVILPLALLAGTAAIVTVLMIFKKEPQKKPENHKAPYVSVEPVKLAPLTLTVSSQGLVTPKYQTGLMAQVSGEIIEVSDTFVRGGLVKKGELLALIDPFNYEVKLQQAKASLASARASFILESAQGKVAEAEWKKITSAEPSELGLRKPQQEQALAAVKAAEAGVKQATKDLERTRIVAPFDALIASRNVSPGTFVNMGTTIGKVLDTELAEVRLPVASTELLFLENGGLNAPVVLTATLSGQSFSWQASIARDEGVVDDNSRMFYLVAELPDPYNQDSTTHSNRLPFGTFVTASIEGRYLESAAVVPRQLLHDNRLALYNESKLQFTDVEVIRHEGKNSVITAGLHNGDMLITSSLEYPVEGMSLALEGEPQLEAQPISTAEPIETASTDKES
ncbi:RND family efflux transporter MFP subunit [Alteromonadaceae bacterium 2753L.S.0a.02]|nr:RND family efflux transporter MFP subunit [Alteromonadaceae bacterium 2753L.S.0a.02]